MGIIWHQFIAPNSDNLSFQLDCSPIRKLSGSRDTNRSVEKRDFEQLQLRSGLVLVATLCSHWRIPDALLSCHRYGEILPPVQSNLATCQIQRSAAARRFRSEQTGSKVRIAR
jgi:hypothetical protein